jgi:iron complex transport system substrate-binding protein
LEEPERIITVGYTDQDVVLALGVVPIATRDFGIERPGAIGAWAQDELEALGGEVPEVLSVSELDFERIATLRPDLILGISSGMDGGVYTTLSQIAPTVAQSDGYIDYGVPWQERARVIGRALGKEHEAEQLVADVEAQFTAAREAHPEFEDAGGIVIGIGTGGELFVSGPAHQRARFLTSLGFEIPGAIAEIAGEQFYGEISPEQLELIDTDVVVWRGVDAAQLAENALYQQLDVAQEGRAIFLEDNGLLSSALSHSTVLSLPVLLDELVPMLAAAVDGDPATVPSSAS